MHSAPTRCHNRSIHIATLNPWANPNPPTSPYFSQTAGTSSSADAAAGLPRRGKKIVKIIVGAPVKQSVTPIMKTAVKKSFFDLSLNSSL